jgi:hypothetical protein
MNSKIRLGDRQTVTEFYLEIARFALDSISMGKSTVPQPSTQQNG